MRHGAEVCEYFIRIEAWMRVWKHVGMNWAEQISRDLEAVRKEKPLVHNITNYVVMNTTANTLLALGASPVMAHALEEVEEMAELSRALVLNIGTLSPPWVAAMYKAARAAEKKNVPIVVDPVGAGATRYRTLTAQALLSRYKVNVLRGNASEILAVHGGDFQTKGVDAAHSVEQARVSARELAKKHGIVVAVTGPEDYVTDGSRVARIQNGHALLGANHRQRVRRQCGHRCVLRRGFRLLCRCGGGIGGVRDSRGIGGRRQPWPRNFSGAAL